LAAFPGVADRQVGVEGLSEPTSVALNVAFYVGLAICLINAVGRLYRRPPGASRFKTMMDGTPGENWPYYVGMTLMFITGVVLARA